MVPETPLKMFLILDVRFWPPVSMMRNGVRILGSGKLNKFAKSFVILESILECRFPVYFYSRSFGHLVQ